MDWMDWIVFINGWLMIHPINFLIHWIEQKEGSGSFIIHSKT